MRDVHATLGGQGGAIAQLQEQVQAQALRMDGVEALALGGARVALGGARVAIGGARSGVLLDEPTLPSSPQVPRARAAESSPAMSRPCWDPEGPQLPEGACQDEYRSTSCAPATPSRAAAPNRRLPLSPLGGSNTMLRPPAPGSSLAKVGSRAAARAETSGSSTGAPADAVCETAPAVPPASGARSKPSTHPYTPIYPRYQTCTPPLRSHYTPYIPRPTLPGALPVERSMSERDARAAARRSAAPAAARQPRPSKKAS